MRRRVHEKLVLKTSEISAKPCGGTVYFRPFVEDAKTLETLAERTGERKSVIAQKLIHLILSEKPFELSEDPGIKKLDWLITAAHQNRSSLDTIEQRLNAFSEGLESVDSVVRELHDRSTLSEALNAENFAMLFVTYYSINQMFSTLFEFLSPNPSEREHSTEIASEIMASLIEHSAREFAMFLNHYGLDHEHRDLFIEGKVDQLRFRTKKGAPTKDEKGKDSGESM